ncbi:MAG: hypothetical protein ACUVQH_05715 [Thermogutta sp.]
MPRLRYGRPYGGFTTDSRPRDPNPRLMNYLLTIAFLLIVGFGEEPPKGSPSGPLSPGVADLFTAYHCDYADIFDQNYDNWPDYWTRHQGPRYPLYVKAEIVGEPSPDSHRSLHVFLDGGSFAATSPAIPLSSVFSYQVDLWVKTRQIIRSRVWLSYLILDPHDKPLVTFRSRALGETPEWTLVQLGPLEVDVPTAAKAVVELHVEGDVIPDVNAEVWFGGLRVHRMPSLRVKLDQPLGLYRLPAQPVISCNVSGIPEPERSLEVIILDAQERLVEKAVLHPNYEKLLGMELSSSDPVSHEQEIFAGDVKWQPTALRPGFYWFVAKIPWKLDSARQVRFPFVVMDGNTTGPSPSFGWSLPQGLEPLGARRMAESVANSGVGWVKIPVWHDEQASSTTLRDLSLLLDRLNNRGVKIVGVLVPPEGVRNSFAATDPHPTVSVLLGEQKTWEPSLTLSFVKMASLVHFWQVGGDEEYPDLGDVTLQKCFDQLKAAVGQTVAQIHFGIPWRWLEPPPRTAMAFISYSEEPPLTAAELENYLLQTQPAAKNMVIFVELKPLDRRHYSIATRAQDLVLRMATLKRAPGVVGFHPDPMHPDYGLLYPNGTPTDLYLPWRTTTEAIGNGQCLGSITLPGGSSNLIFARENEGLMLVWNDWPNREELYLGDNVRMNDVWGAPVAFDNTPRGQSFLVDPWPRFIHGVSIPIARWRQEAKIAVTRLPSVYGVPHPNRLQWRNTFDQAVGGEVTIVTKPGWRIDPDRFQFHLTAGEKTERNFFITLPFDAEAGPQPVRLDFHVGTDQVHHFSSYHFLEVGLGDVYVEVTTRLDESGDLLVHQVLVNETSQPVSFRCELFVPDRRRQFSLIQGQGPGRNVQIYRFPHGEELLGKTIWLRAEELGGSRILNYRVIVTR